MLNEKEMDFDINQFLSSREKRVEKQLEIIKSYKKTLVVVRANYPGTLKNEYPSFEIVNIINKEIKKKFQNKIIFFEKSVSLEGTIGTFVVDEIADKVKEKMISIEENHILGRFVDIDVYKEEGISLSRNDYGYKKRKCYLCSNDAVICTRAMTHSHKDLKKHIVKSYEKYITLENKRIKISEILGNYALKACILEVSCHPSFGLVSPMTQGAHTDMNYFTFVDSSFAIKKGITEMAYEGFSYLNINEIFERARKIGIKTEKEMFEATKGINTHKGMIFLLGISVFTTAKVLYESYIENVELGIEDEEIYLTSGQINKINENIKEICKDICKDFENIPNKIKNNIELTNGEKLYIKHNFLGIRGEIRDGLSIVFKEVLPFMEDMSTLEKSFNDVMVKTLLFLMSKINDSTIVNRKGIEILENVKKESKRLLKNSYTLEKAIELEKKYSENGISPGGSADLLAVTIFFYNLKK